MKYMLEGLTRAECAARLEKELARLDTVASVFINFPAGTLSIECQNIEEVKRKIEEIEPGVTLEATGTETEPESDPEPERHGQHRHILIILISSSLFLAGLLTRNTLASFPFSWPEYVLFLAAYLLTGWNVVKKAILHSLRGQFFDEHFLMTVATCGAILIHQLPEAAGVMLFYAVGEYVEGLSVKRSRKSVKTLMDLRPDYANVRVNEGTLRVSPQDVEVGAHILVKPGEKIPLDGRVIEGQSSVDTSPLTGESLPRSVEQGDNVLAGMINTSGAITIEATKTFHDSSIARILDLVENAAARKANPERFITKFARIYTPLVVAAAACVAVLPPLITGASFYQWVYRSLVLLVISCPCALVLSVPLSYVVGIEKASREGILVKGAHFFDALTAVKAVIFDKTGTLTKGNFVVTQVMASNGFTPEQVLEYAALTETHSNHPIAASIAKAYQKETDARITNFEEVPARGVRAIVNGKMVFVGNDRQLHEERVSHHTCYVEGTVAHVTVDGVYAGYILIADEVKQDAQKTVETLKKRGIYVVMLTGDSEDSAICVAQHVGISRVYAELLPEEKIQNLEEIKEHAGGTTVFVGDGINDAPVIARADIGVAMGALGSDAAVETADVVVMTDRLYKVVEAVEIAERTKRAVWENTGLVLGVKGVFVLMGALGIATMWEAVFADVGVALLAVFNAARGRG